MFEFITIIFKLSYEENARNNKCKEIENYIRSFDKCEPECHYWGRDCGYYIYCNKEADKYLGWLVWWKNTPMKDIIKEKGHDWVHKYQR